MKALGVVLCEGCGIGDGLDLAALEAVAKATDGVVAHRTAACLCDERGEATLRGCLGETLVVAACSGRTHSGRFSFPERRTERVDLRELVVWSHEPRHADTQMLAEDCLRMGLARARRAELPAERPKEVVERILVVGAGPAGLAAAAGAAGAGYEVVLCEKTAELGGRIRGSLKLLPSRAPYRELAANSVDALVAEVEADPRVTVRRCAEPARITGAPGAFEVMLRVNGEVTMTRVGAVVQATGYRPYDATRLGHLGYGASPDVVTSVELEEMLRAGAVRRPSDGARPPRVAFVQCAGSRDPAHLPYCSGVCCRVTIKHALELRELDPESEVYVLARDVRAPGLHEAFYRRAQEDPWIYFTRGEVAAVTLASNGALAIELARGPLGEHVVLEADLVVLAVGMVPLAGNNQALRELADARRNLARNDAGQAAAEEAIARLDHLEGTSVLGLGYRQGPDLPLDRYGFPNSHFICFPYESRRTGIYAAGCVRAPNDVAGSMADGQGAALKAIQCIEHAARGLAVHPRWRDAAAPDFSLDRCTQCKRCTEECPFGSLDEDEKATPKPNPDRCRRCGICLGACPERIVAFPDYSIDLVASMIKVVHIPDELEQKPRVLVLACENDAYPALELAGFHRHRYSAFVRVIPVRCLGSVNVVWIADAVASGFDGVLLLGCRPGDDTQCHYLRGSELMTTRSENVRQKLKQLALEDERVRIEYVTVADFGAIAGVIDGFVGKIQEIGLNPFKDV